MTDSNAIELLRRLLNERGIPHKDHYFNTSWHAKGVMHVAHMETSGYLTVDMLTPEQAIAATMDYERSIDDGNQERTD